MLKILNCENTQTALETIAIAFNCDTEILGAFLANPDIVNFFNENSYLLLDFKEYLYDVVVKHFGEPDQMDGAYWFHTTRALTTTNFADGIQPTGSILPNVWETLISIPSDKLVSERLRNMCATGTPDFQYSLKTTNSMYWGPYGILVREVAFYAEDLGQHDYLGMPEIIEDICNGYKAKYGKSVSEIFSAALTPMIVKFFSPHPIGERELSTALCYVSSKIFNGIPDHSCVYCFDGEGIAVSPSNVISIELVDTIRTRRYD